MSRRSQYFERCSLSSTPCGTRFCAAERAADERVKPPASYARKNKRPRPRARSCQTSKRPAPSARHAGFEAGRAELRHHARVDRGVDVFVREQRRPDEKGRRARPREEARTAWQEDRQGERPRWYHAQNDKKEQVVGLFEFAQVSKRVETPTAAWKRPSDQARDGVRKAEWVNGPAAARRPRYRRIRSGPARCGSPASPRAFRPGGLPRR